MISSKVKISMSAVYWNGNYFLLHSITKKYKNRKNIRNRPRPKLICNANVNAGDIKTYTPHTLNN